MRQAIDRLDGLKNPWRDNVLAVLDDLGGKPGNDVWVNLLLSDLNRKRGKPKGASSRVDIVTITDTRFSDEIAALKKQPNAILIRIYRDLESNDAHASEASLDEISDKEFDYVIDDNGNRTIQQLRGSILTILKKEGLYETPGVLI